MGLLRYTYLVLIASRPGRGTCCSIRQGDIVITQCQCEIAKIRCMEHRRFLSHRSPSCAGSNRPSSQLTLWTCARLLRLPGDTPAHQALRCHIHLSPGRLPDRSWRGCPGRPRNRWLDQMTNSAGTTAGTPPADLWK